MFEFIVTLISILVYIFVGLCVLFLVVMAILLILEKYTSLKPVEWLIDKAMRSH